MLLAGGLAGIAVSRRCAGARSRRTGAGIPAAGARRSVDAPGGADRTAACLHCTFLLFLGGMVALGLMHRSPGLAATQKPGGRACRTSSGASARVARQLDGSRFPNILTDGQQVSGLVRRRRRPARQPERRGASGPGHQCALAGGALHLLGAGADLGILFPEGRAVVARIGPVRTAARRTASLIDRRWAMR